MAVSVQSFRQAFEEFRKTDEATIAAKLKVARLQVNAGIWRDKEDAGVMYLTAHLLALSAAGQNMKLKPGDTGATVYSTQYETMKRQVTYGFRTAGAMPADALQDPVNGE